MLPFWVEFFDDLALVRGRSQNTVMAYRRDLELYAEFRKTQKPLAHFYEFMTAANLSPRSQARVISSVRTYHRFVESRGEPAPELVELRPPKIKVSLPKTLSAKEFERLFQAAQVNDPQKTIRNQVTLLLLYGLGCRVSELIGLNLEDFHPTELWIKVLGKGKKERLVPVSPGLAEQLKLYLEKARPGMLKDTVETALLLNDRGHRPSRVDVWRWLAAWSSQAGFAEPVSPHRFRHACATTLLENGADLRSIQLLLGHASIQTTQIYTSVSQSHLVRTIEEHHPLGSGSGQDAESINAAESKLT